MRSDLISAVDPAGLPGPPWLFHVLLVFTFFIHALFMNLTLGGTLLAWISHLVGRRRPGGPHLVLAGRMTAVNSFAISMAITTGVAPLLFIQLLYQEFFYSGTILLGWIWFGFLILLGGAYYAAYLYRYRGAPAKGSGGGVWLGTAAIAFLLIGMTHVGVNLIHTQPGLWPELADRPLSILSDPVYWPRALHFILAGVGFAALVMGWWALRRAAAGVDTELNNAVSRICWRWVLAAVVLQVVDGLILLLALPRGVMEGIMRGGAATLGPFLLSILLGAGLIVMVARAFDTAGGLPLVTGTLAAMALTIAAMSITRHQVRMLFLDPFIDPARLRVLPQWGNFLLFALLLVAALATVAWMTRRVLAEPASGEEAA